MQEILSQMGIRFGTVVPRHWAFPGNSAVGLPILLRPMRWGAQPEPGEEPRVRGRSARRSVVHAFRLGSTGSRRNGQLQVGMPTRWLDDMALFAILYGRVQHTERKYVDGRIARAGREPSGPLNAGDQAVLTSLPTVRGRRVLRSKIRPTNGRSAARSTRRAQVDALEMLQAMDSPFNSARVPATDKALVGNPGRGDTPNPGLGDRS